MEKYFNQGDVVKVRQDLDYSPKMVVEQVQRSHLPSNIGGKTKLLGIKCVWFDKNFTLQEHIFNTKDLMFADENLN